MKYYMNKIEGSRRNAAAIPSGELAVIFPQLGNIVNFTVSAFRERVFTPGSTFFLFLWQTLNSAACAETVQKAAFHHWKNKGNTISSGTSAYCQARKKLSETFLEKVFALVVGSCEQETPVAYVWKGRNVKIVDGTSVSMPDTPENQGVYPQPSVQKKGCGFPIARILAVFSLASGAIVNFASSSLHTGEQTLLRSIMHLFSCGDVILSDRGFCSYSDMEKLMGMGIDFVIRMREKTIKNFIVVKKLGKDDLLIILRKPDCRRKWMSKEKWSQVPDEICLRKITYHITIPGFRTASVTVLTSLIDPVIFPKKSFAELYMRRWNAELNLRHIKTTMKMDVLRCLTPDMVRKEILVHFIAYNLVRHLMLRSATEHSLRPDSISFKYSLTAIEQWMQAISSNRSRKHAETLEKFILSLIADSILPHRPFRREPRAVKRRRKPYQLLTKPRIIFMEIQHIKKYKKSP